MMKNYLFLFLMISISSVNATPIVYHFSQDGFDEGGSVTGMFIGDDLNGNGQLSNLDGLSEISDFTMNFSGNSIIPAFSKNGISRLRLVYDLDGGSLGNNSGSTIGPEIEGMEVFSELFVYVIGPGATSRTFIQPIIISSDIGSTSTEQLMLVTKVPVLPAFFIFGSGLIGLFGMKKALKVYQV